MLDIQIFKLAVQLLVGGYLHDDHEIEEVPSLLREIADDYEAAIAVENNKVINKVK